MKKIFLFLTFIFLFFENQIFARKVKIPVTGLLTSETDGVEIDFDWDEYFFLENKSNIYNHKLARISALLSSNAYGISEKNIYKAYKALDFEDENMFFYYGNDYNSAPYENDQTSFSFAEKKLENFNKTILLITVRGTPINKQEWISNLNVSDTKGNPQKYHEGFRIAAEQVLAYLEHFVLKKKINPRETYVLLSGHSRGAATINLLAKWLCDDEIFDKDKIFAFPIGCPNNFFEDFFTDEELTKYDFIWNIGNAEDIVPSIPPKINEWKFSKFGNNLTIPNRWNTEKNLYENVYLPKINELYKKFLGRNYEPFYLGSFIPYILGKKLTDLNNSVEDYYSKVKGLRSKSDIPLKLAFFPDKDGLKIDIEDEKYRKFVDMHTPEMYLSWLLLFEESELFKKGGSSVITLSGSENATILDEEDNVFIKIKDGHTSIFDSKRPVGVFSFLDKTYIGFPSTENFTVILQKESIFPSPIKIQLEHFDEQGIRTYASESQKIYLRTKDSFRFNAGKTTFNEDDIIFEKTIESTFSEIRDGWKFYFAPELSFDLDGKINAGINIGTKNVFLFLGFAPSILVNSDELSFGIGNQINVWQRIYFTSRFLWNLKWEKDDFSQNPIVNFDVSIQPFHRFQVFAGVEFWDYCKFVFGMRF